MGYAAEYKTYPIGHNVSPEEIADVSRWLRVTLGLKSQ
jgi:predicted esterase